MLTRWLRGLILLMFREKAIHCILVDNNEDLRAKDWSGLTFYFYILNFLGKYLGTCNELCRYLTFNMQTYFKSLNAKINHMCVTHIFNHPLSVVSMQTLCEMSWSQCGRRP